MAPRNLPIHPTAPQPAHLILGVLGGLPLPLSVALSSIVPQMATDPPISPIGGFILLLLPGLWVILTGVLAVLRAKRLHPYTRLHDRLLGPALLGLLAGPAWIVMLTSGVFGGMNVDGPALLRAITTIALYSWILFNTLWCLAMAFSLLLPALWFADPETPVTDSSRPRR